jgi:hypothetical protein
VWNSGEDEATFMEYKAHGVGDARLTAWADLTKWFFAPEIPSGEPGDAGEEEDPLAELMDAPVTAQEQEPSPEADSRPHFRFALGVKFATGDHKVRDSLDRLLPTRFQPGWGVTSPVVGAGYRQAFGKLNAVATFMYEFSGGENSVDYRHGDVLRLDTCAYYPLCEKYSLTGGLGYSLTWIPSDDRLAGVRVKGTDGTFHSINLVGVFTLYRGLSAALMVKMPFGSTSSSSVNDVDFQYALSLTYSF